jgi:hypothetical protein
MLQHGLQGFEGLSILIPNTKRLQPIRRYRSVRTCACGRTGAQLGRMRPRPCAWSLVHSRSRSAMLLPSGTLLALRTGARPQPKRYALFRKAVQGTTGVDPSTSLGMTAGLAVERVVPVSGTFVLSSRPAFQPDLVIQTPPTRPRLPPSPRLRRTSPGRTLRAIPEGGVASRTPAPLPNPPLSLKLRRTGLPPGEGAALGNHESRSLDFRLRQGYGGQVARDDSRAASREGRTCRTCFKYDHESPRSNARRTCFKYVRTRNEDDEVPRDSETRKLLAL